MESDKKWFKKGLSFQCTGCGKCCSGSPGYVWVNKSEQEAIASFLGISLQEFMRRYTRRIGQRYSLIETKKDFECIFLKDKQCQIYRVRPTQCRTYPWWSQNLNSPQAWEEAARSCEGITPNAPVVSAEEIEEQLVIQIERQQDG